MIGGSALTGLPRAGVMHLIQTTGGVGWTAGAMTGEAQEDIRIAIGPSTVGECECALAIPYTSILTAPLGIERLAARRLRASIVGRGVCPRSLVAYGSSAGELAHAALGMGTIDCHVHTQPPSDARMQCAKAAVDYWRRHGRVDRDAMRAQLGISPGTLVILAGGDRADSIDAREAFAGIGRAILGMSDVALIVPAGARWVVETTRHARLSKMSDRFHVFNRAEIPSQLWCAADALLVHRPIDDAATKWWGWCAWWAMAAGIGVIHETDESDESHESHESNSADESALPNCDATAQFRRGDRSGLVRTLLGLADDRARAGTLVAQLSAGALRNADAAAQGHAPSGESLRFDAAPEFVTPGLA